MNFTVEAPPPKRVQKKQQEYRSSCELVVQKHHYNYQEVVKTMVGEFLTAASLEQYRVGELIRLIRIVAVDKNLKVVVAEAVSLFKKGGCQLVERYYQLWKLLIVEGGTTLTELLTEMASAADRINSYGQILAVSLFFPHRNLLLRELQSSYTLLRQQPSGSIHAAAQKVLSEQSGDQWAIVLASNLKSLTISSEQFRQLLAGLLQRLGDKLNRLIRKNFQQFLEDVNNKGSNQSNVQYLFEWAEWLQPVYFECVKGKLNQLMAAGQYDSIVGLHQRLCRLLQEREYIQLGNLLELCMKEWLNDRSNCLKLMAGTFGDATLRWYTLEHFVVLSDSYKDAERMYIRLQIKSLPNCVEELPQRLQTVTGRNYSSKAQAFKKEVGSTLMREGILTMSTISKLLYPREWKPSTTISEILGNSKLMAAMQQTCKEAAVLLTRLGDCEKKWNAADTLKNIGFAHHRILVEGVAIGKKILSLDQLTGYCTTGQSGDYDQAYPILEEQLSQPKQIEQAPNYVIESKIVRYLKRHKQANSADISKAIGCSQQLATVLLQQLIKKEFAKKQGDTYQYVP